MRLTRPLAASLVLLLLPVLPAQVPSLLLRTVTSSGMMRFYRVNVPPGYQAGVPTPVVLAFHGGGGNALSLAVSSDLVATSDQNGFLLVFPEGTASPLAPPFTAQTWNGGSCCGFAMNNGVDDVQFTADLLDDLAQEWTVDEDRVYATGFSNGGIMSYRLGLELPDRLAAIAPVGAALQVSTTPTRAMPIIAVHGALDMNVPLQGGLGIGVSGTVFTSQDNSIAPFLQINQATLPTAPTQIVGQAVYRESAAPQAAPVGYWLLLDQGHSWPGFRALANPGEPFNTDIAVGQEIWNFFAANPRTAASSPLGAPCGASLAANEPVLGGTMGLLVFGGPSLSPGALWVTPPIPQPLALVPGCDVWVDPAALTQPFVSFSTGPQGGFFLPVALPADPAFDGLAVHAQASLLDPANPAGILLTNGVAITLGF